MHEHGAKRFQILPICGRRSFERSLQLERRIQEGWVLEEQPRLERQARRVRVRFGARIETLPQLCGVEIDVHQPRERSRLLPFPVLAAGWNEGELAGKVTQGGLRQALDEGLAIAPRTVLIDHEQVDGRAEVKLEPFVARRLYDFGRHPIGDHRAPGHDVGRGYLDNVVGQVEDRVAGVGLRVAIGRQR